jgi:DNA replicative helicase MCM subunit Mcm2 (Cdc46/Mcm family)
VEELKKAADFARKQKRIFMDHNARRMWDRVYQTLSAGHDGRFGAATSRAEAQVVRLALLYAMLDRSKYIKSEHLAAALTLWRYCEESARLIFGALTSEEQKIVNVLAQNPLTQGAIRRKVFGDHRPSAAVARDLARLQELKLVELVPDDRGVELYRLAAR